jgi:beta-lactamase regulating signal transducer with metallopeptidase domain
MNPETLRDIGFTLLGGSVHAAVLGCVVIAIRAALGRHLAPRWRCVLWMIVIARLVWPWSLPSPVSLFNITGPILPRINVAAVPLEGWPWIATLWLVIAAALLGRAILGQIRSWWWLRRAQPVDSWEAWWLWEQCKEESGMRTPVAILESARVQSPCLLGLVNTRLLVPQGFATTFSVEEMRLIFLHELAHLRRGDLVLNWLMEIVRAFHWFNPIVWIACKKLREDREEACDAHALAARPGSNQTYGRTLLKFLESMTDRLPGAVGSMFVGFSGPEDPAPESLMNRIKAIARFSTNRRTWVVGLCTVLAVALVGLTDADSNHPVNAAAAAAAAAAAQGS